MKTIIQEAALSFGRTSCKNCEFFNEHKLCTHLHRCREEYINGFLKGVKWQKAKKIKEK